MDDYVIESDLTFKRIRDVASRFSWVIYLFCFFVFIITIGMLLNHINNHYNFVSVALVGASFGYSIASLLITFIIKPLLFG